MAIFDTLKGIFRPFTEKRSGLGDPGVPLNSPAAWSLLFDGQPAESGEVINYTTAMQSSTVFACIRVLSQSIASIPVKLMEIVPDGHKEAIDSDLYYLLRVQPNPDMSAYTFFETLTACLAYTGNGYAQIERDVTGSPIYLWPLNPLKTFPVRDTDTGDLFYKTSDGMRDGQYRFVPQKDVLHVKLHSLDGIRGLSPIDYGRRPLGLQVAQEKAGSRVFGNGSKPGNLLIAKAAKTVAQLQEAKVSWEQANGAINQGRVGVISGEWDYKDLGISNEQSQWLQARQFSLQQIAALFGVPSHFVGDNSKLSGSNSEEIAKQFLQTSLSPIITQFENELLRKLVATRGRSANKYFIRLDTEKFIRTDIAKQYQAYSLGVSSGWFSVNDVRRKLGENPIGEQGDIYRIPVNFANADAMVDADTEANKPIAENDTDDDASDTDDSEVVAGPTPTKTNMRGYSIAYRALFDDAFARMLKRNTRDSESISAVFRPLLAGMAALAADGTDVDTAKPVDDVLKAMAKRSAKWTQECSQQEFEKVTRSVHLEIAKAVAVTNALRQLNTDTSRHTNA